MKKPKERTMIEWHKKLQNVVHEEIMKYKGKVDFVDLSFIMVAISASMLAVCPSEKIVRQEIKLFEAKFGSLVRAIRSGSSKSLKNAKPL